MTSLYVANCTRQKQQVHYRLDFDADRNANFRAPTFREIDPGQQIVLERDRPIDTITHIEEQLRVYGMKAVADIPRLENRVAPLVFNVDKAVPRKLISDVMAHNEGIKLFEGKNRRQKAAVATNEIVDKVVHDQLMRDQAPPDLIPNLEQSTVEFEQVDTTEENQVRLAEGIRTRDDAPNQAPQTAPRRRGRPPKSN